MAFRHQIISGRASWTLLWLVNLLVMRSAHSHGGHACGFGLQRVQQQQRTHLQRYMDRTAAAARKEAGGADPKAQLLQALRTSKPATIRIRTIDLLGESDYLADLGPDAARYLRELVIPGAIKVIQKFVQVRVPMTGALKTALPAGTVCGATTIRPRLSAPAGGAGYPAADMALYVTANYSDGCFPLAVGYTVACDWHALTGRPTVAAINFCPRTLSPDVLVEDTVGTIVHELLHALGFYVELFPMFYDHTTGQRYSQPITTVKGRPYASTPRARAVARDHYACPSLVGAPLEEEGGSASRASHWDSLQLNHEVITPIQTEDSQRLRFTNFTLSLLDDTGFYKPNYAAAQVMDWGWKQGCSFVLQNTDEAGCAEYARARPRQQEVCRSSSTLRAGRVDWGCSYNSRAVVACYQGGTSLYANGCELGISETSFPILCSDPASWDAASRSLGASMGLATGVAGSRCFALTTPNACTVSPAGSANPIACSPTSFLCARAVCSARGVPTLRVRLHNGTTAQVACDADTVDLKQALPGHFVSGVLHCPLRTMCRGLDTCPRCDKGYCFDGRCNCYLEATGPTCSTSLLSAPPNSSYSLYRE